ncbi:MAG: NRAMP family divalent metal transporter [Solirubrobacteraceae bacterium]
MTENESTATQGGAAQAPQEHGGGVPPVLDDAHIGDIRGALGTIRVGDTGARYGWRSRLMALLAIMGPGLIVMVADNDAGGVSTYVQAGQNYGPSLLWVLVLLIPVLIVNQEMVIRLGAVTGVGHARLINERFGRFWGWFSVGDLFLLNFLTIVTEFIGVSFALGYFGVSRYVAVPIAAVLLIAITSTGSFRSWERFMYLFIFANVLTIPLFFMAKPSASVIARHTFVPGIAGGASSTAVLLIVAVVGTTIAPWQLFFQQSNIIDKRITPRWINYERADTVIGAFVTVLGAGALICVAAFAFGGTLAAGHFGNAGTVAADLHRFVGPVAGAFFAVVLLNASLIGAASVTLATSYAFGDVFGVSHSLHRGVKDAKAFYAIFAATVALAAAVPLIPHAPLGLITTSVQALAGVLLPSATVFLVLLCNDREVLGPWVNSRWLNLLAAAIVGMLVELSLILVMTTVFTKLPAGKVFLYCSGVLLVGLIAATIATVRSVRRENRQQTVPRERRQTWTMPPLALLKPTVWSPARKATMLAMRAYLVVAVALLIVKTVRLGG